MRERERRSAGTFHQLTITPSGNTLSYLTDKQGSVYDATLNAEPTLEFRIRYTTFGDISHSWNSTANGDRYGFQGREREEILGLNYYRARYVSYSTGRFWSQDPIGFNAGDPNLYRFVGNSPANRTDPSGLMSWDSAWNYGTAAFRVAATGGVRAFFDADGLARDLDTLSFGYSTQFLNNRTVGAVYNAVDQTVAGFSDALTMGGSTRLRSLMWGEDATRNHQGTFFDVGRGVGMVYNVTLSFVNPCALTGYVQMAYRGIQAAQAVAGAINAADNFAQGNYFSAGMDALGVLGNVLSLSRACFTGDMLLDVEGGKKRADTIQVGDKLWARNEFDPHGAIELKEVEEVFVRVAPIVNVHVAGQIIKTTKEHP